MRVDEDALYCDFAETYHIYDIKQLPLSMAAVFACGLREDSRIMMKLNGIDIDSKTMLMAMAVDYLSLLWWAKTKDGQRNKNRPKLFSIILGKKGSEVQGYRSAIEFEQKLKEFGKEG
ncbi:MAG: DUF5361 domain-containing protein [Firmicutes bacterium]|nr:DUF5361 domain-containing protein [Bacillota bacterium]